jgi:2'-5' RNA ligase
MKLQSVTTVTIPGYRIYEYLLVLSPHEELQNKISKTKQEFNEKYKIQNAAGNWSSLALVNFLQYEMMEERIISRLRNIAMGYPAFKVELKEFGSFPSHTIFINVTSKLPVQGLVKEIRHETQRLMKLNDENKPHFIMEPHITIAGKLQPWQYEKGWLEYSHKHFTGRFIADSMLLLKRPVDKEDNSRMKYHTIQRFEFQNMPVTTKQGSLFI